MNKKETLTYTYTFNMKRFKFTLILAVLALSILWGDPHIDSLYRAIENYHGLPGIEARLEIAFEMKKSDFEKADFQARKAYMGALELGDIDLQAKAMYYLGLTHYFNDKADTALTYLDRSMKLYRKENNYEQLAKVLCVIGSNYLGVTGDQSQAIVYYNEALVYARKAENHRTMAIIYSQLSNIFRMNGIYQRAIEFIYKSKEHYKIAGFHEGVAWVSYSIGRIYTTMSLYKEAQKEYIESLEQYRMLPESVSSLNGEAICLNELGLTYLELGNADYARQYNLQAQKIYSSINSEIGMSNTLKYLARIEHSFGNYEEALKNLEKSRKIKKKINDVLGFPGVYDLYGEILIDQKNYRAAIDSLNVGLKYATQNTQKNSIMSMNKKLAEIYAEIGEFEKAYTYRTTQFAIVDSIHQSKVTRELTQLEALYDLEIRETKIRELEREKQINTINLEREIAVKNLLLIILAMTIVFSFFFIKLFFSNRQANETLQKNQKQLQELNATKDKFTSIIAHDLKSPFNTILGFSSLLERYSEKKDFEKIKEFSGHLHQVSTQTYKLLENLLEWSQSQTGKITFTPKALDIRIPIKNAVDLMAPAAKRKQIEIISDVSTIVVLVDENMLHTILQNLLSNAIKYSHPGGKIFIKAEEKSGTLKLKIKDEGVGMGTDTIQKLFHIDETVSLPGTEGERGTGLGLILSKEFIERHRGEISVESEKDKGSCFIVELPL
ncbi:MAG: tetratricopeptide repeat protein [Candidatus Marinimicrobia bacterium]|nr:tetratricopeptide repeat protein [Candidatus Neomarinimicrobiota bacterium]